MILCDLDGVLSEFAEPFSRLVSGRYGTPILGAARVPNWEWRGVLTQEQMDYGWQIVGSSPTFWDSLSPCAPAAVFAKLASYQTAAPVIFCTARVGANAHEQTSSWLGRMGIAHPLLIVTENGQTKGEITRDWPLIAAIEDSPSQAMSLAENDVWVYLVDYPYNRRIDHENIMRCRDTEEAVERAIKRWQG